MKRPVHRSARHLDCAISTSLYEAIEERQRLTGESINHIVQSALAEALDIDHHSIFQVSTSGALLQGVLRVPLSCGRRLCFQGGLVAGTGIGFLITRKARLTEAPGQFRGE